MTQIMITECSNGKKLKRNHSNSSFTMMGKYQKFPKGYSSSFIPDNRHAAETVGESEGFGISCHVDTKDSCTPKRKYISLTADERNGFYVPIQVISMSKMSGPERKAIEKRLRGELDKVQILQNRLLSCNPTVASGLVGSSSNDKHVKKQGSDCGVLGRFEPTKQAPSRPSGKPNAMVMKQCETILKTLMTHKYSAVFLSPVNVVALNIPDYFTIIKHPMDLGTIKKKLLSGSYSSPLGFSSDVRLTFTNAMTYNPPSNYVHIMADALNKMFEKRWERIREKLATAEVVARREEETIKPESPPKKRKTSPMDRRPIAPKKSVRPKITYDDKQKLRNRVHSLVEHLPDHIIAFLRKQMNNEKTTGEEIEIDFDTLGDDALFQLQKLLDDYFGSKKSEPHAKVESCEIESLIESGISNSSMHPCKGIDPLEEDVDIDGDDPLVSSYPPVEMERGTSTRSTTKCSSSSSDSGSSSDDSDSDSSSGSESDAQVGTPAKPIKETGPSGTTMEQVKCGIAYPVDTRSVCGMGQQEHHARPEPLSIESDAHHDDENATSKRQVSPEKMYRAALLKNRFADTILKAREKTINQNERDPARLRQEREELERQQREEKAQLQAEAEAVEIARRRAEAKAAAEAKRQRQFDREKARQALIQMEKSVEINENSLFMKDLEMLKTAPGDIISEVHETSPDQLQESMAGYSLGGSNLLEKLGLFMKNDEDEEEEGNPSSKKKNDVEEGEID